MGDREGLTDRQKHGLGSQRKHGYLPIGDRAGVVRRHLSEIDLDGTELDRAALRVGCVMRFSPARNCDRIVPVWVALPVIFRRE